MEIHDCTQDVLIVIFAGRNPHSGAEKAIDILSGTLVSIRSWRSIGVVDSLALIASDVVCVGDLRANLLRRPRFNCGRDIVDR